MCSRDGVFKSFLFWLMLVPVLFAGVLVVFCWCYCCVRDSVVDFYCLAINNFYSVVMLQVMVSF